MMGVRAGCIAAAGVVPVVTSSGIIATLGVTGATFKFGGSAFTGVSLRAPAVAGFTDILEGSMNPMDTTGRADIASIANASLFGAFGNNVAVDGGVATVPTVLGNFLLLSWDLFVVNANNPVLALNMLAPTGATIPTSVTLSMSNVTHPNNSGDFNPDSWAVSSFVLTGGTASTSLTGVDYDDSSSISMTTPPPTGFSYVRYSLDVGSAFDVNNPNLDLINGFDVVTAKFRSTTSTYSSPVYPMCTLEIS